MSKLEITLNIGGKLSTGDVVGIAYNNRIDFGWFVEAGKYGSLKYISFGTTSLVTERLDTYNKGLLQNSHWKKVFEKDGLTFNLFFRDYIISFGASDNRAFKIYQPDSFFKGSDKETQYLEGRKILNSIKFPAK